MANYKADTTLNERDSLQDMLNLEKQAFKMYATCLTEGVSKGFRTTVKRNLSSVGEDQFKVYSMMTEHGYAKVCTAPEEQVKETKTKFESILN